MSAAYALVPADAVSVALRVMEHVNDDQSIHFLGALHDLRQAMTPERIITADTDSVVELGLLEVIGAAARDRLHEMLGPDTLAEFYRHASEDERREAVQHASIMHEVAEASR